jgi:acylphosphatase
MTKGDRVIRHVFVRGKVQGIGFRVWTERQALSRGLEGWVRNRSDGSVEALFAGPPALVKSMIEQLRKGAPLSTVDRVDERDADSLELAAKRNSEKFSLLPTV